MIRHISLPVVALACLPFPALAQGASETGVCGQPLALTQMHGDVIAPGFSDISLVLKPQRSEPAYLEFEVGERTDITLETLTRDVDPVLSVFAEGGRVVTWDDDGAGNLDARAAATLEPGKYCAQLRLISTQPVSTATVVLLAFEGLPPDPAAVENEEAAAMCADPGQTPVLSDNLRAGDVQVGQGNVTYAAQLGGFRITLPETTSLEIDALSEMIDTVLTVRDADGVLIAENDDHQDMSGSNSRISQSFSAGDYCLLVRPYSESEGPFTVSVTALGGASGTATGGLTIPEDGGEPFEDLGTLDTGILESSTYGNDHVLWVAFENDAASSVQVDGMSMNGEFSLFVFDADGTEIQSANSATSAVASMTLEGLAPGRYFVAIADAEMASGVPMRHIRIQRN